MFTLKEIVKITNAKPISAETDLEIKSISTDSRTIKKGELFIALKGEYFDGSNFINDAKGKGACAAVVPEGTKGIAAFPLIRVKNTKAAFGSIAKAHRDRFNIPIIAITGSNGKTTTREMIAHILSKKFKVLKTEKNENNKVGVARTLLRLKDQDIAVIEVGTNSRGEIKYHSDILRPDAAVITNIGPSHLEGLRDTKGVLKEKLALVESLGRNGVWIKNADDKMLSKVKILKTLPRILTYGINKKNPNFRARNITQTTTGIEFILGTAPKHGGPCLGAVPKDVPFIIPVFGKHNVYNALAAIAACLLFVDIRIIQKALANFKGPKLRTQVLNIDGVTVINDCYNSNPLSFECAVSALKDFPVFGRRIVVTADMLELGENSDRLHYQSGELLARKGIDRLITFGEQASRIASGAIDNGMDKERVAVFRDKSRIAPFLRNLIKKGDVILIKGSRGMKMEEVSNCFTTYSTR